MNNLRELLFETLDLFDFEFDISLHDDNAFQVCISDDIGEMYYITVWSDNVSKYAQGIHLFDADDYSLADALESSIRDNFTSIIVHSIAA